MKTRPFICGGLLLLVFIIQISIIRSSEVRFWTESDRSDLERGTLEGVALLSSGGITLSPSIKQLSTQVAQSAAPFFWCQASDSSGNLYIGSGNNGTIFRISMDGKISPFFNADEMEVTALAVDRNDAVFAGTSPQGKIYRITKEGKSEIFSEPGERYIWGLAFDPNGNLFAATGEEGLILKILKDGQFQLFFDSNEANIVSLAFDKTGNILAGSDGRGVIYRISPAGKSEVLFSLGRGEITSIAGSQDGAIFFTTVMRKEAEAHPSSLQLNLREIVTAAELDKKVAESAIEEAPGKRYAATLEGFPFPEKGKAAEIARSSVFIIPPGGEPRRSFDLQKENIYTVCPSKDGKIYVGAGEPGRFYRLEEGGKASLLHVFNEAQVVSAIPYRTSEISLITSNMGSAYLVRSELERAGTFISRPFDAGMRSEWGTIRCLVEQREGTKIELFTRSGNTQNPDSAWSGWSRAYDPFKSEKIESPAARFIQWKAHFSNIGSAQSAILRRVTVAYIQINEPPEIKKITIVRPGQKMESGPQAKPEPAAAEKSIKTMERGETGIIWDASDPNGDALLFTIFYRSDTQADWMKIDEVRSSQLFLWNHLSIPDGTYRIKVKGDDSPSNFAGNERSTEMQSETFTIDHTPPEINVTKKEISGAAISIALTAHDANGIIAKLLFSNDQKDWHMARPDDGICDSADESFHFSADRKDSSPIFLRCIDDSLNEATLEVK